MVFYSYQRLLSQILTQSWWEEPRNRPKWLWEHITELYIVVPDDILCSDENLQVLLCVLREVKVLKGVTIQTLIDLRSKTKAKVIKEIGLFSDCTIDFVMWQCHTSMVCYIPNSISRPKTLLNSCMCWCK